MSHIPLYAVLWVWSGVLAHGLVFAAAQREWPLLAQEWYWPQQAFCLFFVGIFGPVGLLIALNTLVEEGIGFRHGFKLW